MQIQQAYNKWAQTYDTVENKTRDLELIAAQQVLASADFSKVLEIGCGTGKNTAWLCNKAGALTAIDFSENMLEVARRKITAPNVQFLQADITQPWKVNKASLVICSLVLEHIENIDFIFSLAASVLENDGCFYVCELHPYKQMQGSQAKFEHEENQVNIQCFVHHISDFIESAAKHQLSCVDLKEWFDNEDRSGTPRLVSFLFKKAGG